MTLTIVMIAAAALFALGLGAALRRRSLIGMLIGIELGIGALILLATALFDLSGTETSTGGIIALAAMTLGVGAAALVAAFQLRARRDAR